MRRVRVIDLETTGSRPLAHDVCELFSAIATTVEALRRHYIDEEWAGPLPPAIKDVIDAVITNMRPTKDRGGARSPWSMLAPGSRKPNWPGSWGLICTVTYD